MAAEEKKQSEEYVWRPPTPFIDEQGESKGWNELEYKGWKFYSQTRKAVCSEDRSTLAQDIGAENVPLPEIVFGNNKLTLFHESSGITVNFNAKDALASWSTQQKAERYVRVEDTHHMPGLWLMASI